MLQRRSRKSRPDRSVHRSGDAVLTSPRVVVDADGEFLYIPADRALAARAQREAEEAARAAAAQAEADAAQAEAELAAETDAEMQAETAELEAAELREAAAEAARVKIAEQSRAAREEAAQVRAAQLEAAQAEALAQAQAMAEARTVAQPRTPIEYEPADYPSDLEIAIAGARAAARRRAVIMALLFVSTVTSWVVVSSSPAPAWVGIPATGLLVLHMLASRVAGLRSRETLMLLAVQVHTEELAESRAQRQAAAAARPAEVAATVEAALTPDRVARRAAAVGATTWDPVPVPPPTYTLKPAVHRPEPAPLERPAAAVSRGALPRRAADVERILAIESHLDELFEEPKVVNG